MLNATRKADDILLNSYYFRIFRGLKKFGDNWNLPHITPESSDPSEVAGGAIIVMRPMPKVAKTVDSCYIHPAHRKVSELRWIKLKLERKKRF